MSRKRILLADDHKMLLAAFRRLLEPDHEIVGVVEDGRALIAAAEELVPDIIVLDIAMPLLNGIDAARQIKQNFPDIKLIFLTVNEAPDLIAEAFRAGASGYLLKSSAASELHEAIERAVRNRSYITPLLSKVMVEIISDGSRSKLRSADLTHRQREVLQLLAEGQTMKEAALALKLSPRTVAFHKYRIMEQLKIKTNAELIQFALKERIVSL